MPPWECRRTKPREAMHYLLVRHKVADFNRWREFYDSERHVREEAGLVEKNVFRNLNDPNEVILLFGFEDLMKAEELVASRALRNRMVAAGVEKYPSFYFLT